MITQCPNCQARFRLPLDQVTSSRGEVFCGECQVQFNALEHLVINGTTAQKGPTLTDRVKRDDEYKDSNTLFLPIDDNTTDHTPEIATRLTQQESPTKQKLKEASPSDKKTRQKKAPTLAKKPVSANNKSTKYQLNQGDKAPVQEKSHPFFPMFFSIAAILLLIAIMGLQYLLTQREHFSQHRYLRPVLIAICPYVGCTMQPKRRLELLAIVNHSIETHPQYPEALLITIELANYGNFEQNYPIVELIMTNIRQEVVASRHFYPDEYLPNFVKSEASLFAADSVEQLKLEVVDPGSHATGFEFILHHRR